MSRKACSFKQSDVTRALLAAKKADVQVTIRIAKDGVIEIQTGGNTESPPTNENVWDEVLNAQDAKRSP